jgi:ABC-type branched-subunit amino acid transport system ATPase component
MRFSWAQHQNVARKLGTVEQQQLGVALALMGASLLMLVEDLAALESRTSIW